MLTPATHDFGNFGHIRPLGADVADISLKGIGRRVILISRKATLTFAATDYARATRFTPCAVITITTRRMPLLRRHALSIAGLMDEC